ncbi:FAD-dependent oxidoreductase [Sphingomonas donggukensis]|uniref:FAD-dependent oxidoreductase n=1 Tax=Sphingomonas donggukensis TaxID=2949093 RepID=A0ABY4TRS9_9SPHN|nr:FAD-dependent oxidoreductase [Sphingomonas donggukensis]URW75101.1 FAD-dependent oxidoreductase [Sphingomonas donggukensis]
MIAAEDTDVLVIGSGAGGLSAAVAAAHGGCRVVVVETSSTIGGASAWSGGWMWVPGNPVARRAGIAEDAVAPRAYLRAVLGNRYDAPRVEALLRGGPAMVSFFEQHTRLRFEGGNTIPDIYGDLPGASRGGRSIIAERIDMRGEDDMLRRLRPPMRETSLWGLPIQAGADLAAFLSATRRPASMLHVARRLGRHAADQALRRRARVLVNGAALVARLALSARDAGVMIRTDTSALRLSFDGRRVTGAIVETPLGMCEIKARRGVVLATGGISNDQQRRARLFPHSGDGSAHWSLPPADVAGDGARLAEAVGAVFDESPAAAGAWCPVSLVPHADGTTGYFPHIIDRGKPGIIAVLRNGRRFVNEANGYHDYVAALLASTPPGERPESWLIAGAKSINRYGLGFVRPWPFPRAHWIRRGYLVRGRTLDELAAQCGINAAALRETAARFDAAAHRGEDPAFGRGASRYNRHQGDPAVRPNPTLAPLGSGPFYAIKVVPGSFGSFAGISVDPVARALNATGLPIAGLHVVGADAVSALGGHYPAGGINLGPAMTFGFLAGRTLAGLDDLAQEDFGWN